MKTWPLSFLTALLLNSVAPHQANAEDLYDYKKPRATVESTTINLVTKQANGADLPLVLLIGDPITTGRYSAGVSAALKEHAYVSLLGTAKAVGDPALLDEIRLVLRQNAYSIIHFGFGMHGDSEGLRDGFPDVIATIQRHAPQAKLIWAPTTPRMQRDGGPDKDVIEKNKIAADPIAKAGIHVDDLYTLVAKHPTKLWDAGGVHFTTEGTALLSAQVAQTILPFLPARPKPLKVLMIGNSQCPLIINNRLIENLAVSDKGAALIQITGCIKGGSTLKTHWEAGTGPTTARGMIAGGSWDFVVLQEIYVATEADMHPYARQFHELIKSGGAKTVFFGTASIIRDYPQGFDRLHRINLAAGKELDAQVVDSSHAYFRYLGKEPSAERMESLFAKDKMHPGLWGSYIYACGILQRADGTIPHRPRRASRHAARRGQGVASRRMGAASGNNCGTQKMTP